MDPLTPKDHGEEVAVFRHSLIGELVRRELDHGERSDILRRLSEQRVRPPGSDVTRCYSVPTLERWLYDFKRGGLAALIPQARSDRGRGRDLDPTLRDLLCDIRREHPYVSVTLMLRTLRADGRVANDVKECTVRRMLAERGLIRTAPVDSASCKSRLRWQAERPSALWHGDVCHGTTLVVDDRSDPVRVHALMDDASRMVVALLVTNNEREETMLSLFVQALMEHGKPDALYLDNGATYRGEILQLVCSRLGITLLHARPYDAPARGKMERFWRRMREQALSTQLESMRATGSATLAFVPTIPGEPFADRVARYLNLTVLQDIIDGKLAEALDQRASEQVVTALKFVVQPSTNTVVEHQTMESTELTPVERIEEEEEVRTPPKGPEYSDPLVLLGYQSGVLDDWDKLQISIFPGTRIRLPSTRDHKGLEPTGIDLLKHRNDFLFRPALFTLVRQRLGADKRKYWLQSVRLVNPRERGLTVTAIPSTVVGDAFVYRLDMALTFENERTLRIHAKGEPVGEIAIGAKALSGAQEWMRSYAQTICKVVELGNFKNARLGPIFMPEASPLYRVLVILHEAGGHLHRDDVAERIREEFGAHPRIDPWAVLGKAPALIAWRDGELALTAEGEQYARAYVAVERRSVPVRKQRRPTSE